MTFPVKHYPGKISFHTDFRCILTGSVVKFIVVIDAGELDVILIVHRQIVCRLCRQNNVTENTRVVQMLL